MRRLRKVISGYWFALAMAAALTSVLGTDWIAFAQEQSMTPPQDAIVARKTMMTFISDAMDMIERMTVSGKIDLAVGGKQADQISVMLYAFPHLFAPATNQWKPKEEPDPLTDTLAAPELWQKFPDFYARAGAASQTAFKLSRAKTEADFKALTLELRTACDGCHAAYMKQ